MAITKSDIKFYLTSSQREIEQTMPSQSLGGFDASVPSDETLSLVYPETTFSQRAGVHDTSLVLDDYTVIENSQFINSNFEVIRTNPIVSNSVGVVQRGVNGFQNFHIPGDPVRGLNVNSIFNDNINDELKQYRCIAIKNTNAIDSAYNLVVYLKQNSRNQGSKVKIALEQPKNDRQTGTATGGTTQTLVDSSLIGQFADNHFAGAEMVITEALPPNAEFTVTVLSFDASTGTIVFTSAISQSVLAGDTYVIKTAPAQRIASGLLAPATGAGRVTAFSEANRENALAINVDGNRGHGDDFMPNDVMYIWLERSLKEDAESFDMNNVILSLNYFTVS